MTTQFGVQPWLGNPKFKPPEPAVKGIEILRKREDAEAAQLAENRRIAAIKRALRPTSKMVEIASEVAAAHGFSDWRELRQHRRFAPLVTARMEAMARCYHETEHGLSEIGRFFGFDHSTVLHAARKSRALENVGT